MCDTWIAGTRVKYPIRMMHSSVAMFFMIDQLSLLRPARNRQRHIRNDGRLQTKVSHISLLTLSDAEFDLKVDGSGHH